MPLPPWLDIAALSISTAIATSLILIVLGAELTHVRKHSFALFTLMEVIWVISALFFCLSLWSEHGLPKLGGDDSLLLLELSTMPIGLVSVFSLLFTVLFLDRRTRWTDLATVLGLLLIVALAIPTFGHQPLFNLRIDTNRITIPHTSLWRWMGAAISVVYVVWYLALLWQERHRTQDFHLALVMLILLIGIVAGAVFDAPALFVSLSNALSAAILGYEIVSRQILNPLRERASDLQQEVAERKRVEEALWQRTAQLEALEAATTTVNSTLDYDEVLKRILEQIGRVMPQAAANIMLVGGNSASVLRGHNYEQLGTQYCPDKPEI